MSAIAILIVGLLSFGAIARALDVDEAALTGFAPLMIVPIVLLCSIALLVQAFAANGAIREASGQKPTFGEFFQVPNLGQVLLAAVIVGVVNSVLSWIPYLGLLASMVVYIFTQWTLLFIIDRNLDAISGIKASISLSTANLGNALLVALVQYLLLIFGAIVCGIGLFVTAPVALLFQAYTYRALTGRPPMLSAPQGPPPGYY